MNTTDALNMALEALRVELLEVQFWTGVEQTTPWALQDKPRRNKAARRAVAQSASIALEDDVAQKRNRMADLEAALVRLETLRDESIRGSSAEPQIKLP